MEGLGEGRSKKEGIYVCIELIHAVVPQKLTWHCEAMTLQLKDNKFLKNKQSWKEEMPHLWVITHPQFSTPWQPLICFLSLWTDLSSIFYINGITHSVVLPPASFTEPHVPSAHPCCIRFLPPILTAVNRTRAAQALLSSSCTQITWVDVHGKGREGQP